MKFQLELNPYMILICIAVLILLISCAGPVSNLKTKSSTGQVTSGTITSKALANNLLGDSATRPYGIYLPPGYETSQKRYPVVYMLHGYTQSYQSYTGPLSRVQDLLTANGKVGEMIIVFVDASNKLGGSWYLSSPSIGDYGMYITQELVTLIDTEYRTLPHRESRGITGCSMGGYGAAHLAFNHPNVYAVAAGVSGSYDWENIGWDRDAGSYTFEPKNWIDWIGLNGQIQLDIASAAGGAPNPNNPPFYADIPFKLENGKGKIIPEVYERINAFDIPHDIVKYLKQPVRLKNFMIYHGSNDSVQFARDFVRDISDLGIEHQYIEVNGGNHCDLDWAPVLQFMSDHLVFE